MRYIAGIDDTGSTNIQSEGWAVFLISEEDKDEFSSKAQHLLSQTKMGAFHGKNFKRRFEVQYKEFLLLIKDYLEKENRSLIACSILNESWKNEYREYCKNLIIKALDGSDINDPGFEKGVIRLAGAFFDFQKLTSDFSGQSALTIEIDKHSVTEDLSNLELVVKGITINPLKIISVIYNGNRKTRFPNSPELIENGINILCDEDSFLIQAADIFGNFSLAYSRHILGGQGEGTMRKAEIFEKVFGDLLEPSYIKKNLKLEGDELILKNDGEFCVKIIREE